MNILTREKLTAPHYLAYKWIIEHIPSNVKTILDFGARDSKLPLMLSNKYQVTVYDRDPVVEKLRFPFIVGQDAEDLEGLFDCIICCWSLQHNSIEKQQEILIKLFKHVPFGGSVLLVQKFPRSGVSRYQSNRADPCWLLCWEDIMSKLLLPTEAIVASVSYFWYNFNTVEGEHCRPFIADAICLELVQAPAVKPIGG